LKYNTSSLFTFLFILVLGSVAGPAWADVIPVQNASFEITNPLNIPCSIPANCNFNFGPIPDWTLTGAGGSWHPSAAFYNLPLPDGSIVAFGNGGTISQTLSTSVLPNTGYTLSVDVGHRLDGYVTNYTIAIYAGSKLLDSLTGSNGAIPIGTFAEETLSFMSGATAAGDLRIVLTSAGSQADFDNVRLMTDAPEPASLSLLAVACGLILFVFRRR
jgi:hypothetical protein